MKEIGYFLAKVKFRIYGHDKEVINRYFRKAGMKIGGGVQHLLQYNDNGAISDYYWRKCYHIWKRYVCNA